jgi:FHS family L-fucose permease-like MFS transporter
MYQKALRSLTVLFFMMGFITCLNDILVPYLKKIFELSYKEAALIQLCFFGAYGLISIPATNILEKIGYHRKMISGFTVAALGCMLFFPAIAVNEYWFILIAMFVLATGLALLQVAANPYVAILGEKETAPARLSLVQAFNSVGTFLAPFFGCYFFLKHISSAENAEALKYPYGIIAVALVIIAIVLNRQTLPSIKTEKPSHEVSWKDLFKHSNFILGMMGIFAYVGAEVAIGSFLVNYIIAIVKMPETKAATFVALYWGGSLLGRFSGALTLKFFSQGRVLAIHAIFALSLILISINSRGMMSVYSMVLIGLANSIMFPTIFTMSIKNLTSGEEQKGSGLLSTAIVGGAIVPVIMGFLIDKWGFRVAFLLPVLCYAYIGLLGLRYKIVSEVPPDELPEEPPLNKKFF